MNRVLRVVMVCLPLLGAAGCGSSEPTGPKPSLSDAERQQVKDLNQQRQDEWGKGKK